MKGWPSWHSIVEEKQKRQKRTALCYLRNKATVRPKIFVLKLTNLLKGLKFERPNPKSCSSWPQTLFWILNTCFTRPTLTSWTRLRGLLCVSLPIFRRSGLKNRLIESGIESQFSHLTKFVERGAVVANTAFGKLVGNKPDGEKNSKLVRRKIAHDHAVKVTTLATQAFYGYQRQEIASKFRQAQSVGTQVSNSPEFPCPSVCLFYDSSHALEKCFRFRDRSYKESKEFVLNKRLCMNCFKVNHVAKRCRGHVCSVAALDDTTHVFIHLRL